MGLEWDRMASSGLVGAQRENRKAYFRRLWQGREAQWRGLSYLSLPQATRVTTIILPGPGTPLPERT